MAGGPALRSLALTVVVALGAVAVLGCALPGPLERSKIREQVLTRELEQDIAYLAKLNVLVKEGRATESDRERLWQAYVARNKMRCGRAEGFCYETDVFVAPSF